MRLSSLLLLVAAVAGTVPQALAKVVTKEVDYKDGDTVLKGYMAYDDAVKGKRPGVLVAPEWWGLNDYTKKRARDVAELGYVALAMDVYGNGTAVTTPEEAGKLAGQYKGDRALMRRRALAAFDTLAKDPHVDTAHIAAIGYCFGGTTVLELARSGAAVKGTVSFHGGLDTPTPDDAKNIKGKVLVLTGGDDPNVPPAQVDAFEDEMRSAKVDWQLTSYGGAVHAFTNPASGNDPAKGVAYNAEADKRSFVAMEAFFKEIFHPAK